MRVLCRVWQRRNKRVGGADDERIIIDRSWLSACKQRCTEPVPWNLSIPWSIKKWGAVVFVITISSFVTGLIYQFILVPLHFEYLQTIVFILVIAALVQFVEMFLKKAMPPLYQALGVYLPLITTNCAVLGVALTNVQKSYSIGAGVVNGVATAVGFLIAIVLMAGIREKIEYNDVPESFQGTPIVLVTAGLMAIAFFGFSGLI
jgi:electron transport complex protein RnfA